MDKHMIDELILKTRSIRRFRENEPVSREVLKDLVNLARLSPSAANRQPLKYLLSNTLEKNAIIFPCLAWAGYLIDWPGPEAGERPSAYIVMLGDRAIVTDYDADPGIGCQSIVLGARERGLGACIFGAIDRRMLHSVLGLSERFDILYVIALGYPAETVVLENLGPDGDIRYWRDENGIHHVPKRSLAEIIVE
ncbi:MAG TPA: nitroreductase family protein [Atribacteraceae bacterium]|nr:nitroreductase family protein [Atribacteraceae bacterium]